MNKLLLINILLLFYACAWGQHNDLKFEHIDIHQGLSNNQVRCVLQDSYGFLWIGTRDGLNRYDGYKFVIYSPDNQDSTSLLANEILCMAEDEQKRLWIGTLTGGLFLYDRPLDRFQQFYHKANNPNSLPNNNVNAILPSKNGKLWIGTDQGLTCFDASQKFTHLLKGKSVASIFQDTKGNLWVGTKKEGVYLLGNGSSEFINFNSDNTQGFRNNFVASIQEDAQGSLILGTHEGLMFARWENNQFTVLNCFTSETNNPLSISNNQSGFVFRDSDGKLWICENNSAGLDLVHYIYKNNIPVLNEVRHYKHIPFNPHSLASNRVRCVYKDHTGIYWIGTEMGLNKYVPLKQKFWHVHNYMMLDKNGLSSNEVRAFVEDEKKTVWLATYGGGLNSYSLTTGKVKVYPSPYANKDVLKSRQMLRSKDKLLWITTSGGGIYLFDTEKEQYKNLFVHKPNQPNSLINNEVGAIYEDQDQTLWIGTEQGLCKLTYANRAKGKFDDLRYIINDKLNTIVEDAQGRLWIATETNGLIRVNKDGTEKKVFQHEADNPQSLPQNNIRLIYKDEQNRIWVGTGIGLSLYNPENESFTTFDNRNGFPNSVINGVLQAGDFLWISTNEGLLRFNPQTQALNIYRETDGLQSDEFRKRSFYKGKSGMLYFGGLNGFNYFYPDRIKADSSKPKTVLTNFKIFNQEVAIQPQSPKLSQHISITEKLELSYQDYVFSLEFAALHFHTPKRNQYAYRLENFEKNWNYVDATRRFATYTNLDAGIYYFKVKAANADGVWNEEETILQITIKPPFWETYWFITIVILSIIGGAVGFYRYRVEAIEKQKIILENLVKQRTEELEQEKKAIESQNILLEKQRTEILNKNIELEQRQEEIVAQRDLISTQNNELSNALHELNKQNQKITASIRYAQTIQQAILPTYKKIARHFSDFFVIYRPKDIVSGDFYWIAKEKIDKEEYIFAILADCTGHGVSGAFMSLIGYSLLNEIIRQKKEIEPSQILEELDQKLTEALTSDERIKEDGMDIAICRFNKEKNKVKMVFCGAKRPIYLFQNGELQEMKGNKRSIGGIGSKANHFIHQEIRLDENAIIYLFSDGYTDQQHQDGRKIGTLRFKQILQQVASAPLSQQAEVLEHVLKDSLKVYEQRDDITILGLKL